MKAGEQGWAEIFEPQRAAPSTPTDCPLCNDVGEPAAATDSTSATKLRRSATVVDSRSTEEPVRRQGSQKGGEGFHDVQREVDGTGREGKG